MVCLCVTYVVVHNQALDKWLEFTKDSLIHHSQLSKFCISISGVSRFECGMLKKINDRPVSRAKGSTIHNSQYGLTHADNV